MRIAIVSVRGIPNLYGGLEEFAEHLSVGLVKKGHEVIVYSPSFHPYKERSFKGVQIIKKFSPEKLIGTPANFIYDFLSIRDAIRKRVDVMFVCGYSASAISFKILPVQKILLITNIDGLEWRRSKFNPLVRRFLMWSEKIALEKSDVLIADNPGISRYLSENFNLSSEDIAYGADIPEKFDETILQKFGLKKFMYNVIIARLEPENNIEVILDGVVQSKSVISTHIFANDGTSYGRYLKDKYKKFSKIVFHGWVSGQSTLASIRYFAKLYFHGHSVGGTNPSLLEAMAGQALIVAHDNEFNKNVLNGDALYFSSEQEIAHYIDLNSDVTERETFILNNLKKIRDKYNWEIIVDRYEKMFASKVDSWISKSKKNPN